MLNEDEKLAESLVYCIVPKDVLVEFIANIRRQATAEEFEEYKKILLDAYGDKK